MKTAAVGRRRTFEIEVTRVYRVLASSEDEALDLYGEGRAELLEPGDEFAVRDTQRWEMERRLLEVGIGRDEPGLSVEE